MQEARGHYDAALPLYQREQDRLGEANVLQSLGDLESRLGNVQEARGHYDAALPLYQREQDRLGEANVLQSLGDLESRLGNVQEARGHYDAALPLYQREQDRLGEANVLKSLGDLESRLGNVQEARGHYDAALPLYQREQARLGEANVYMSLADMFLTQRDWQQARDSYEQALPLFVAVHDPLGQANTLIDLGLARFALGEQERGMSDVQQARELFSLVQDEEWARRAEQRLAQMQASLKQPEVDVKLLNAFLHVQSAQEMVALASQHSQLLSNTWFATVEALLRSQENEEVKEGFRQRLETLKQLRQMLETASAQQSEIERIIVAFAGANWAVRRQMLAEHKGLLSEQVESVLDRIVAVNTDTDVIRLLEDVRTLLRRCRTWGSDAIFFFEQRMRLGDGIVIPPLYEPDVMQAASLLVQQSQDTSAYEQAVQILTGLLNRLTADTSPLFEGALLRDLAELLSGLPEGHPARKLEQIESYYREALPLYQTAGRQISVAILQHSLGNILSEQGRYAEALELLQVAIQCLQGEGNYQRETAWALSSYASTLDALGSTEEALDAYARAIALLPDTPPLLRNRAETLIHARRLVEAESDLERVVELDGNEESSYLWFRRAQIAIARGDGLSAEQMLDEAVKRSSADNDVVFARVQSAWLRGEQATAQDWFQQAINAANPGKQATMRRELEVLQAEHPNLPCLTDV